MHIISRMFSSSGVVKYLVIFSIFSLGFYSCQNKQQGKDPDLQQSKARADQTDLRLLGMLHNQSPEYSNKAIDSAFAFRKENDYLQMRYLNFNCLIALRIRDYDHVKLLDQMNEVLDLGARHKNNILHMTEVAKAYFAKGDIYCNLGHVSEGLKNYYLGGRLVKEWEMELQAVYFRKLGMLFYRQGNYRQSIEYFKQEFEYYRETENSPFITKLTQQEILDNIGLCYTRLQMPQEAIIYYEKAADIVQSMDEKTAQNKSMKHIAWAVIKGNKAKACLQMGDTVTAIRLYKESIASNLQERERLDAGISMVQLAELYSNMRNNPQALELIHAVDTVLPQYEKSMREKDLLISKYNVYKKANLKDSVISVAERLAEIEQQQRAQARDTSNETQAELLLKATEREDQLRNLKEENVLRKRITLLISLLFAIIGVTAIILLFSWRSQRRKTKQLLEYNKQVIQQQAELKNANEKLKELNQSKDRILGIVVHDLRSPVAAIRSLTDLFLEEDNIDPKSGREFMEMIRTACNSSLDMINEILTLSDKEKGKKDEKKERVSLKNLISSATGLLRFKAEEKKQRIHLSLPDQECEAEILPERIRRIFSNLVINAVKFSSAGSNVYVTLKEQGDKAIISVRDEGIGIPDDLKENIFDSFTRSKRTGTMGEKSFGLGLSIVKEVVNEHQGKVWFESEEGKGTTFYIELLLATRQ